MPPLLVALRKESVDRNIILPKQLDRTPPSLSARRAWIEIPITLDSGALPGSLSARRAWIEIIDYIIDYVNDASRSPQGERG